MAMEGVVSEGQTIFPSVYGSYAQGCLKPKTTLLRSIEIFWALRCVSANMYSVC